MKKQLTGIDIICIFTMLLFFLGLPCYGVAYSSSGGTTKFTVKRVVEQGGEDGKYLIFTEGGEVLENTDTILFGKWDSSDLQAKLEEGKTYSAEVAGWRVPVFSMYRNVITVTEAEK